MKGDKGYTEAGTTNIANISGIAYTDGKFFLSTNSGMTYSYSLQNGAYERENAGNLSITPTDIAADLYGTLYVMTGDGDVYRYDQNTFFNPPSTLDNVTQFSGATRLLADYRGDLYALCGSTLVRCDVKEKTPLTSYDLSPALSLVYNSEGSRAVSFALGFDSAEVYILSDAFVAVTTDADVASLDNLSAADAYTQIYERLPGDNCAQDVLVRAEQGCVSVLLDMNALSQKPSVLPCLNAERISEARTGVVLAQTEYGVLALFYNYSEEGVATTRSYELRLLLENGGYTLLGTQYYTSAAYSATLSNDVGLYRYPLLQTGSGDGLQPFGVTMQLNGGESVYVLGTLTPKRECWTPILTAWCAYRATGNSTTDLCLPAISWNGRKLPAGGRICLSSPQKGQHRRARRADAGKGRDAESVRGSGFQRNGVCRVRRRRRKRVHGHDPH